MTDQPLRRDGWTADQIAQEMLAAVHRGREDRVQVGWLAMRALDGDAQAAGSLRSRADEAGQAATEFAEKWTSWQTSVQDLTRFVRTAATWEGLDARVDSSYLSMVQEIELEDEMIGINSMRDELLPLPAIEQVDDGYAPDGFENATRALEGVRAMTVGSSDRDAVPTTEEALAALRPDDTRWARDALGAEDGRTAGFDLEAEKRLDAATQRDSYEMPSASPRDAGSAAYEARGRAHLEPPSGDGLER